VISCGLNNVIHYTTSPSPSDSTTKVNQNRGTEERASAPNLSLRDFKVIDAVKATLKDACPGVTTCPGKYLTTA
jgi:hypothetical protein